jgi:hypothetical protein
MCIGTDDKGCWHDKMESDLWIGKDVTGSFHDKFQILCGLEQMIEDDAMT